MSGTPHDPELTALEAALSQLAPLPGTPSRDTVLFQAGRASMRGRWVWPALAAVSSLIAVALLVLLSTRAPRLVERIVYVPVAVADPAQPANSVPPSSSVEPGPDPLIGMAAPSPEAGYLRKRYEMLRWGVQVRAAPASAPAPKQPLTPGALRDPSGRGLVEF